MDDRTTPPADAVVDQIEERRRRERDKKQRQRAAMTEEEKAAKRKQDSERKRRSWEALSEEEKAAKRKKNAEGKQLAWASLSKEEKAAKQRKDTERNQKKRLGIRFVGVDCEGAGTNAGGQQNLVLMSARDDGASDAEKGGFSKSLHKGIGGCEHISSEEAFEWILSLPGKDDAILVGYFFGYDATQILRDIGPGAVKDLFDPKNYGRGGTRYWTHFNGKYAVKYVPKQYLAVARRGGPQNKALPETARYIFDVYGLFQQSFVKTANDWRLDDPAVIEAISDMKNRRRKFAAVTSEMLDYNSAECRMLAQLMTRFRVNCYARGIRPRTWTTAGVLAAALLTRHRAPKRPLTAEERKGGHNSDRAVRWPARPREFEAGSKCAFFAGRQEATRRGHIRGPVYRQDIHSAYPSKLLELPCQMHMKVRRSRSKTPPAEGFYLAFGIFRHPPGTIWGGLPVRDEMGRVSWPLEGSGWWWSPEIRSSQRELGMTFEFGEIWIIESPPCTCDTFGFVRDLYEERRGLGEKTEGLPLKFAMSAITGKFSQKHGTRPWYDLAMGGLVNSLTRAQMIDAIGAVGQRQTIKLMTDCIYHTGKPLPAGDGLGQFGPAERLDDLWIVKPGVSWQSKQLEGAKTRGIPSSVIAKTHGKFERAWHNWLKCGMPGDGPAITVEFEVFVGLKTAALGYRNLKCAGRWEVIRPSYGFGWRAISTAWTRCRTMCRWWGNSAKTEQIDRDVFPRPRPSSAIPACRTPSGKRSVHRLRERAKLDANAKCRCSRRSKTRPWPQGRRNPANVGLAGVWRKF